MQLRALNAATLSSSWLSLPSLSGSMVLAVTIDFTGRDLYFGAPSTQYWVQLSTAIVGGLTISTFVTVLFTPSMLAWWDRRRAGGTR